MICLIKTVMCMIGIHDDWGWQTTFHPSKGVRMKFAMCSWCGHSRQIEVPSYTLLRERRRAEAHARREAA
jgi:hypothetical protein